MKNAFSIDLEDCFCNEFLLKYLSEDFDMNKAYDQVTLATDGLLKLLNKYDIKATFFILGKVAEKIPDYVKMLHESGHEIGSHAYSHTMLNKLGKAGFEEELKRSTAIIRSATGEQPLGFRAPSFSLDQSTAWALEVLEKNGYRYDSSIFPIRSMLYGVPKAPLIPYKPSIEDITKHDPDGKITEFPITVLKSFTNIPVAGGFYLRSLPSWFLSYSVRQVNRDRPVIIYIHPWETYKDTIRLKASLFARFEAYFGIKSTLYKMERLFNKYKFAPVREVLDI
jgi:polysaccharide deacetylase family protein (PEP-CTERM system associated)